MTIPRGEIILVVSKFNERVTKALYQGALEKLAELGIDKARIKTVWVPGAFEIPHVMQKYLKSKSAIGGVALGAVIRGETPHFDYVSKACADGVMRVMLDLTKPVAFGVLTTDNADQAFSRAGGQKGNKGSEAVQVLIDMLGLTA